MTTFRFDLPHHWLARQLHIKTTLARQMLEAGTLPEPIYQYTRHGTTRFYEDEERLAVEHCRLLFDTPIPPFVADLRALASLLDDGGHEVPNRSLHEFKHYNFGEDQNGFYPVKIGAEPWKGHRVQVTRDELIEAGYEKVHAARSGFYTPQPELLKASYKKIMESRANQPFNQVWYGGEVPLHWNAREEVHTRLVRSAFFCDLARILEKRAESLADLVGSLDNIDGAA